MSRLTMIERDALPLDQRRFHDAVHAIRRRPISGPFIVTMNSSPDLAARFAHLGHYFHARGQPDESIVPIRVRAFVSLLGSRALDAPYEWAAWVNWALEAGIAPQTVDAIREGNVPPQPTAEEMLVTDFCTQMITGSHRVSDTTFAGALAHFGAQGVVELIVTLGYFAMIALPLNAFEIEMTAAQMGQRKPFAPLAVNAQPWTPAASDDRVLPPFSGRSIPRLPPLRSHSDLVPEHAHFFDRVIRTRGWIAPLFQMLLHSPDAAERIATIGEFFLYQTILAPAPKALVWLTAARELDCGYTWFTGAAAAQAAGVDPRAVEALLHGRTAAVLGGDQALIDFCLQLLRGNHHVDAATYAAVAAQFGIATTVQITTALGYVVMVSLIANALEVETAPDRAGPAL